MLAAMAVQDGELQLSITPGSDPISGRLTGPDGQSRPFSGWLELSAAIEAARSTDKTLGSFPGAKEELR
jgi:hypothetical protein